MTHSTRAVRELTGPLLTGLSPALGQTASQLLFVVQGASMLGSGMGILALAAAGVAGVVGGKLVTAFRDAITAQSDYQRAVTGFDLSKITIEADKALAKIDELRQQSVFFGAVTQFEDLTGGAPPMAIPPNLTREQQLDQLAKDRERIRAENEMSGGPNLMQQAAEKQAAETFRLEASQRGLFDFLKPALQQAFDQAMRQARDLDVAGQSEAATRLRAAAGAQFQRGRDIADAGLFQRPGGTAAVSDYEGQFFGEAGQGKVRELLQSLEARDLSREIELLRNKGATLGENAVSDYNAPVFGAEAQGQVAQKVLEYKQQGLELDAKRADIATRLYGLTQAEVAQRELESIALHAQADLEDTRLSKGEKELRLLEAQANAYAVIQREAERTDATAGLRRGLTDVEEQFGAAGLRMQEEARQVGDDIQRALSDSMLSPFEERLKNLPPLFKSILTSMLRAVTDDFSKQIVAQLFSGFRQLLPGGDTSGSGPFGSGSGGGGLLSLANAPTGAPTNLVVNVTGRPLSAAELNTAYAAQGEAGVRALQGGQAVVSGGQFVPQATGNGELPGLSIPSGVVGPSLLSRALPIAGGAAALGLTALGATGAKTGFDVGASGVLGGLAGASLGRSVGNLFDAGGVGAGTGALAGAAVTTTLAMLAKQQADAQAAKARQTAEIERAAGAGGALVSSASSATNPADLYRRIAAFGSGYSGGTANPAVPVTVDTASGPKAIGAPNSVFPTATLADLIANPGSLKANIQAGVDPSTLVGPNATTSKALSDMATDLVNQFHQTEQGVGITQTAVTPGGLTRRTTVPASRASQIDQAGGTVEVNQLALNALSSDDQAALLLDVLGRVATDQDIASSISDPATGQIVSITRIARSTIGLPGATTPVPAPVTTGTPAATTPPVSTAEILAGGGALTLGIAAQLADPASLLNQLLPAGYTGEDLFAAIQKLASGESLTGAAGTLSATSLETQGSSIATMNEPADIPPGTEAGFGSALSSAVGGIGGILSLVQGARTGDPVSILSGVAQVYNAVASGLQAANVATSDVLPTLTQAAGALYDAIFGATTTTAVEVGAETGAVAATGATAALAAVGAIALPIAAVLLIKGIVDIINGINAADEAKFQARKLTIFQNATLPGIIKGVANAPALLSTILNPNATPDQVRAAAASVDEALANYNASDVYFKGGMKQEGGTPYALNAQLAPYLQALAYAKLYAADRLGTQIQATAGDPSGALGVALGYGPAGIRNALLPDFLQPNGPGGLLTSEANLAGLRALGLPTQRADGSPITLDDVLSATLPNQGGAYQNLTTDSPYGIVTKSVQTQLQQTLTPGHYISGLQALAAQYGGAQNPFLANPVLAAIFAANPTLAIILAPALMGLSGQFAPPQGGSGPVLPADAWIDPSVGTPGGEGSSSSPGDAGGPGGPGGGAGP